MNIKVLTAADLHQSRMHVEAVSRAAQEHRVDAIALAGDVLGLSPESGVLDVVSVPQAARHLASINVKHMLFVRGNHEEDRWVEFAHYWPHQQRPLVALDGTGYAVGPLIIVGFPCLTGRQGPWCSLLPPDGTSILQPSGQMGRELLTGDIDRWLPSLMRKTGPGGKAFWLCHEPPFAGPLARLDLSNPAWGNAVERFKPLLTVSGHDHKTPLKANAWVEWHGGTACINAGQEDWHAHYCILDFEFAGQDECLPARITATAYPWGEAKVIFPSAKTTEYNK